MTSERRSVGLGALIPIMTLLPLALAVGGCAHRGPDEWEQRRPPTYPVTGVVMHAGAPVAGATVVFVSEPSDGSSQVAAVGRTDGAGRFRLRTFRDGDGAVAGSHAVQIEKLTWIRQPADHPEDSRPPEPVSLLPERYRTAATSGLTAAVAPSRTNEFRFDLHE